MMKSGAVFQFTCPSRSTTGYTYEYDVPEGVSIHVPLAEHDWLIQSVN